MSVLIVVLLCPSPEGSFETVSILGNVAASVASDIQSYKSLTNTLLVGGQLGKDLTFSGLTRDAAAAALNKVGINWESYGVDGNAVSWLHKGFCISCTWPVLWAATCRNCPSCVKDNG